VLARQADDPGLADEFLAAAATGILENDQPATEQIDAELERMRTTASGRSDQSQTGVAQDGKETG
jgi:hypothetical protein